MVRYVIHSIPGMKSCVPTSPTNDRLHESVFAICAHKEHVEEKLGFSTSSLPGVAPWVNRIEEYSPLIGMLLEGDVVISVNGQPPVGANQTAEMLRSAVGDVLIILARSQAVAGGMKVRQVSVQAEEHTTFGILFESEPGISMAPLVKSLSPASALSRGGVHEWDTVIAINGRPCIGAKHAVQLLKSARGKVRSRAPGHATAAPRAHAQMPYLRPLLTCTPLCLLW